MTTISSLYSPQLIVFIDRCPPSQLAVINPVPLPSAVHCGAACEALQ